MRKIYKAALCCLIAFLLLIPEGALAYDDYHHPIRVQIGTGSSAGIMITAGKYDVINGSGSVVSSLGQGSSVTLSNGMLLSSVDGLGRYKLNSNGNEYRGDCKVSNGNIVSILGQEEYLYSVVMSEIGGYYPDNEALKAQAVAARSLSARKIKSPRSADYDILSSTSDQVYKGYSGENASSAVAGRIRTSVDATCDEVAFYGNEIADTVYMANAGGHTENVSNVWGGNLPYLNGVDSHWDALPFKGDAGNYKSIKMPTGYQWSYTISAADLSAKVGGIGTVTSVTTDKTGCASGYAKTVTVTGTSGSKTYKGSEFRSLLSLRSSNFNINPGFKVTAAKPFSLQHLSGAEYLAQMIVNCICFNIEGYGYGHSVGMSQWAACVMADEGYSYDAILKHFYSGIEIKNW